MIETRKPKRKGKVDYQVGYGKPPRHSRFQKGHSGNLRGRPKGARNFKTDVKDTLKATVKLTRDGETQRISTQKAMLLRLRENALNGDARALDRLIALAQSYNNEELMGSASLNNDDAALLQVYKKRVLSGATSPSDSERIVDKPTAQPVTSDNVDSTPRRPRERFRLKTPIDAARR